MDGDSGAWTASPRSRRRPVPRADGMDERQARRARLHKEAERRWEKLGRERPELEDTIAFGRGLVARYIDDLPRAADVALTPEEARAKLAAGMPLLEDQDLGLDLPGIRRFFVGLCAWAGDAMARGEFAGDAGRLAEVIREDESLVDDLVAASLAGDERGIAEAAGQFGVAPVLLQSLTGFTVSAALMGTARALAPLLEGVEWAQGICPVCGGPPLLAELTGSEGQRVLRCAACGAGWKSPRARCPHCGNEDQRTLHYLAVEGQAEKYRVDLCDRCHGYVKSATSFEPTPAELLTIEDAALLHLDALARERGYTATPEVAEVTDEAEASRHR